MTIRSRLVAYLVPLLALGSGVSLAASGPAIVSGGTQLHSMYFPADSSFVHRGASLKFSHRRIAQNLHCVCCGKDENGHCNHQCCT
jgi:hypothetical protein